MPMKTLSKVWLLLAVCILLAGCVSRVPSDVTEPDPPGVTEPEAPPSDPYPWLSGLLEKAGTAQYSAPAEGMLRKFPYPYKAMLSIVSDCDSTTVESFESMHRFLNTYEETEYGKGLGLDIGDSFFIFNGSNYDNATDLMTYCAGTDPASLRNAELIKKYYDCGWIDSIHAFGDFSNTGGSRFTRDLAISAWEIMDGAGIAPAVWIDHGTETNIQNFGAYNAKNVSRYQQGDNPQSDAYHTDITLSRSIRYVWYSRHSDQFGQAFPLKEKTLRDGRKVWSFVRYTSEMIGKEIDWTWRPNRLRDQITESRLDRLEERGEYSLVAQHLTSYEPWLRMEQPDIDAMRLLAQRFYGGRILVARSSRVFDYAVAQSCLRYETAEIDGWFVINIRGIADPVTGERVPELTQLSGLTFYCDSGDRTVIIAGEEVLTPDRLAVNPPDETGRPSVSVPWFAADTYDYTAE